MNKFKIAEIPKTRPAISRELLSRAINLRSNPYKELGRNFSQDFPIDLLISDNRIIMNYPGVNPHYHDYMEILYVLGGDMTIGINGTSYHVQQDDLLLIKSEQIHWLKFKDEYHSSVLTLLFMPVVISTFDQSGEEWTYIHSFLENSRKQIPHITKITATLPQVPELLKQMYNEYIYRNRGYQTIVKGLLLNLIGVLYRGGVISLPGDQSEYNDENFIKLLPAIHYMEANSAEKLSMEDVARVVNMSYYHFSHLFSHTIGESFKNYLNYIRIRKSEELFLHQGRSISEAAYDCGFNDLSSFNRAYKRLRNCTPREYIKAKALHDEMLDSGDSHRLHS